MATNRLWQQITGMAFVVLLLTGCSGAPIESALEATSIPPTATPMPSTATPMPPTATAVPTATPTNTPLPLPPPSDMVYVPAGEFVMGSEEGRSDEQPVHTVYLDAFYIDKTEVTNAQYAQFLNEQGNRQEGGATWLDVDDVDCLIVKVGDQYQPRSGYQDHPVIEVTWYGARAYCKWRDPGALGQVRLPTEAEWEKAASWDPATETKRIYPWGNEWDGSRANAEWPIPGATETETHTMPVGTRPEGASSYGVLDMAGNVWEWVADWYAKDYYDHSPRQNPQGPSSGADRVMRGGSWHSPRSFVRTTVRDYMFPTYSYDRGFRCACSP